MSTQIRYNGEVVTTFSKGTITLNTDEHKLTGDIEVTSTGGGTGGGISGLPIEVDALDKSLLAAENDGKIYKCDDKLYQVEKITSLKGLTIKFNDHLTSPCPIGEDDVFDCDGVAMMQDFNLRGNPHIVAIRKKLYLNPSVTSDIAFTVRDIDPYVEDDYYTYDLFVGEDWDGNPSWMVCDENGNVSPAIASAVVSNFDCPELNENPAFIEWVFANAKVYSKIESTKDIKEFKFNLPFAFGEEFRCGFAFAMQNVNHTGAVIEFDVDGRYTATFSVNGELITKTFTDVNVNGDALLIFSNGDDTLTVDYWYDDNGDLPYTIKYNDIVLEGEIIFIEFDCIFNKEWYLLSFILPCTNVSGEYNNGYAFKEFVVYKKYYGTVEVE